MTEGFNTDEIESEKSPLRKSEKIVVRIDRKIKSSNVEKDKSEA